MSACEGISPWNFKAEYRGQLTPSRQPGVEAVQMHGGPFQSRWLRVGPGAGVQDVLHAVDTAEQGATTAVYVGVPDDYEHCGSLVKDLRARGFEFHHLFPGEGDAPAGELIYYRWAGKGADLVPSYSTALEGVGVMVLSPDEDELLLAWEYGNWKMITGNVDAGESIVSAVRREVGEEVGLELGDGDAIRLMGGWQDAKARDERMNIFFCVFTARAKSRNVRVDGVEIGEARWFPLNSLPTLDDEQSAQKVAGRPFSMEWGLQSVAPEQQYISRTVARFLEVHRQSRGLEVRSHTGSGPLDRRDLFC